MAHPINPELAALLQTLNSGSAQPTPTNTTQHITPYQQSYFAMAAPPPKVADPRRKLEQPVVDPGCITTWEPAMKYVSSVIVGDFVKCNKIKQLIKSQHDHERRWWSEREAIVKKHKDRDVTRQRAQALLSKMANGAIAAGTPAKDVKVIKEAEKTELKDFDENIYQEFSKLTSQTDSALTALKVPFFCIKHDLFNRDGLGIDVDQKLNLTELKASQKRMVGMLEALFGPGDTA